MYMRPGSINHNIKHIDIHEQSNYYYTATTVIREYGMIMWWHNNLLLYRGR